MNDGGRLVRADPRRNEHAVGQPTKLGLRVTAGIALGNDETAIGGHAPVAPISSNLVGQAGVKLEATSRKRIQRRASAPVERQKAASLA